MLAGSSEVTLETVSTPPDSSSRASSTEVSSEVSMEAVLSFEFGCPHLGGVEVEVGGNNERAAGYQNTRLLILFRIKPCYLIKKL